MMREGRERGGDEEGAPRGRQDQAARGGRQDQTAARGGRQDPGSRNHEDEEEEDVDFVKELRYRVSHNPCLFDSC